MRAKHLYTLILGLSLCTQAVKTQPTSIPELEGATVGYKIVNLSTGKIVDAYNENLSITPASVQKLITTATALEILGEKFQFETKLAYSGSIKNDTLFGNIYIIGGGDPTLGSEKFIRQNPIHIWTTALQKLKLKHIAGAIISDASIFDYEAIPPTWNWQDMGNYYAAGTFGLSIFDNTTRISFKTGIAGTKASITKISPEVTNLQIDCRVVAANIKGDNAYFYGEPYSNYRYVSGELPANTSNFIVKGDIPNPPMTAAYLLLNALVKEDISVANGVSNINDGATTTTINSILSPTLEEIIKITNVESNNLFAEHLFKTLALTSNKQASYDQAIEITKNFWKEKGINGKLLFVCDGSGLSDRNTTTANWLTQMLTYMAKSPNYEPFFNSLPKAGYEGTVKNFLANTPLKGKAHLKTGSMSRIQCYAGYILLNDTQYAFAILINNFTGSRREVIKAAENILNNAVK